MSLTSLLETPTGRTAIGTMYLRRHLRPYLQSTWTGQPLPNTQEPSVSFPSHLLSYSGHIGTAWDYWVRAWLSHRHRTSESVLIAQQVARRLFAADIQIQSRMDVALERREQVRTGQLSPLSRDVLWDCVFFAFLEPYNRVGGLSPWRWPSSEVFDAIIDQVTAMADILSMQPDVLGPAIAPVWLNPTFGEATRLVDNADGDAVVMRW